MFYNLNQPINLYLLHMSGNKVSYGKEQEKQHLIAITAGMETRQA